MLPQGLSHPVMFPKALSLESPSHHRPSGLWKYRKVLIMSFQVQTAMSKLEEASTGAEMQKHSGNDAGSRERQIKQKFGYEVT